MILVSFLKASQQWSLVGSCDVFDAHVVGTHLYTIRTYLAMCYAFRQISYWYIYDFLGDILFIPFCNNFVCTSFFVDWYHHDLHLPRILYTWEKLHIYLISPSFTSTFSFLFYFFGGSVKVCVSSADLISFHLDALFCGEDHSLLLVLMRLCHFYWYPSSWQSYPFYIFTIGCHKHRLFIWLVVSLWTHLLLCVGMIGLALCISFIQEYIDA